MVAVSGQDEDFLEGVDRDAAEAVAVLCTASEGMPLSPGGRGLGAHPRRWRAGGSAGPSGSPERGGPLERRAVGGVHAARKSPPYMYDSADTRVRES